MYQKKMKKREKIAKNCIHYAMKIVSTKIAICDRIVVLLSSALHTNAFTTFSIYVDASYSFSPLLPLSRLNTREQRSNYKISILTLKFICTPNKFLIERKIFYLSLTLYEIGTNKLSRNLSAEVTKTKNSLF